MKEVLLAGIFLLPVLTGFYMEGELRKRWQLLEALRRQIAGAVLLLQNSRKPLHRELEALQQGAEDERLGERERRILGEFVKKTETASRGELLLLGIEAEKILAAGALEAETAYKNRGRLCRALGLVCGSGAVLLLL